MHAYTVIKEVLEEETNHHEVKRVSSKLMNKLKDIKEAKNLRSKQ